MDTFANFIDFILIGVLLLIVIGAGSLAYWVWNSGKGNKDK